MNILYKWMNNATAEEKKALAELASSSVASLRQLAGGYRGKNFSVSAEFAGRLEAASRKLQRKGLPLLLREDLCPACASCGYLKMCRKGGFSE